MPIVEIQGLEFSFNQKQILKDISMVVQRPEFVSIVGPSGCGKSTLLRLIAGLLKPSSGKVKIDSSVQDRIGFVFQESRLLPWLTVEENLLWGQQKQSNLETVLRQIQLTNHSKKFPAELSGGMKMRASIGRALMRAPSLIVLDEPFSALDENTKLDLQLELLTILNQEAKSVVMVTHSFTEAVYLSDRIIVMTPNGQISAEVLVGQPRQQRMNWEVEPSFQLKVKEVKELFRKGLVL